jgi:hypothetical protein
MAKNSTLAGMKQQLTLRWRHSGLDVITDNNKTLNWTAAVAHDLA